MPDFAGLFTPSGALCFLAGVVARRMWCIAKNKYLDRVDPAGAPHRDSVKVIILAWGITLLAILYIGLQTQATNTTTVRLTRDAARCWQESYQASRAQIKLNADNYGIIRQQLALQRDYDRATSKFWKALVSPPGALANAPINSPARQAYGLQLSDQYQADINRMGAKSDDLVNQQNVLDAQRAQHPLPEVTCGK